MAEFRRQALVSFDPQKDSNAGLWLDKFLLDDKEGAKNNLIEQALTIQLSKVYGRFYDKWKAELTKRGAQCREAETLGRLAINLGADSTLENSIALNRTYGVPYIPGSALKGLAASYYRKHVEKLDARLEDDIFGVQENAGWVIFYDALFVPKENSLGLKQDVVTVHHQEYYQGDAPPADWDSPIPIPFLSVVGTFCLALSGPDNLVNATYKILKLALAQEGIGAKTNGGYGRMKLPQDIPAGYETGVVQDVFASYAFIKPDKGGKNIFVHFNELADDLKTLDPNQKVMYATKAGKKKDELQATDVSLLD